MSGDPSSTSVVLDPTGVFDLDTWAPLSSGHGAAMQNLIEHELSRYPDIVRTTAPTFLALDRAVAQGEPVGARFEPAGNVAILTPRLDVRGNVHRVMVAALMHAHPEPADALRRSVESATEGRDDLTLYEGAFDLEGHVIALVAAVVVARPSLSAFANRSPDFAPLLSSARAFLLAVGFDESRLRSLPPCPPYAFTSVVEGGFPEYRIEPGGSSLHLRAPGPHEYESTTFVPSPPSAEQEIVRGVVRDVWVLPEGLLGSAVMNYYVVEDVREATCDIAGFQSGAAGKAADIIVERKGRRSIFYHELGHAIHNLRHDDFPTERWMSFVPAADGYFGTARDFIRTGTRLPDFSGQLLDRGFITSYASSAMEEDIAECTEALLIGDERLWAAMPSAPLVAGKVACLIEFLHDVDPTFTREYFEQLATERRVQETLWGEA